MTGTNRSIQFDRYVLDLGSGELTKDGNTVKLHPQPAELLVLLAKRAGEVVGREEIQKEESGPPWSPGLDWSPDGETLVTTDRDSSNPERRHSIDPSTVQRRPKGNPACAGYQLGAKSVPRDPTRG